MARRTIIQKLEILADAAKYDASCASSGSKKRNALGTAGIGSTEGMGICHSYAPDGRCISLLKVLLTNFCVFDCRYCINRSSSNVQRERFSVDEIVTLTLDFYRRNYIEGLFLSSGIIRSPNYTMEQLMEVARSLREDHGFLGYIHLKTIAEADPELIRQAGIYADRLSVNVELPSEQGLSHYAPEKSGQTIRKAMADIRHEIDNAKDAKTGRLLKRAKPPAFAPGGQSTQMIVGADASSDADILQSSSRLYAGYGLKRIYYSAYSPVPDASADLPPIRPPLIREHRLYQADWMFRFYGFSTAEITSVAENGMLDLDIDPKLAWALKNRGLFPMDINTASYGELLRIPGLGPASAKRIVQARRHTRLTLTDLGKIVRSLKNIRPFITAANWSPGHSTDSLGLRDRLVSRPRQMDLFS